MTISRRDLLQRGGVLAGAAVIPTALAACTARSHGGPAAAPEATTGSTGTANANAGLLNNFDNIKGKKVGMVVVDSTATFPRRSVAEVKKLSSAHGFSVEIVDGAGDYNKINAAFTSFATKGVDAVIDVGCEPDLCKAGLASTTKANIPVGCIVAGYQEGVSFDVEANDWISYARLGSYIFSRLGFDADKSWGAALINWPNVPALRIRSAQIQAMLDYYKIPVLSNQVLVEPGFVTDAKQKAQALLTRYPKGGQLKVIIAGWDDVGVAVAQAVSEAGRDDVFVVSADGNTSAYDIMRKGGPFAATCASAVETMADVCVAQLSDIIGGGKPLGTTLYCDAPLITKENLPEPNTYPQGEGLQLYYQA